LTVPLALRDVPAANNHRILKIEGLDLLSSPATAEIGWNWNDMHYVGRDLTDPKPTGMPTPVFNSHTTPTS